MAQKIATMPPTIDIPPNLTTDKFDNITGKIVNVHGTHLNNGYYSTWLCFAKIAGLQIESVTKLHVTNVLELLVFSMKSRLVSRRSFEIKSVLIFNWLFLWNSEIWFDCLFIKIDLLSKFNFQHISRNSVTFWWDLNSHTKSSLHLLSSLINQHFLYSIFFIRFVLLFCYQVGLEKDFIRVDTW